MAKSRVASSKIGKRKSKAAPSKVVRDKSKHHNSPEAFFPRPGVPLTLEKRREFLEVYAQGGSVKSAAEKVGITHVTVFNHVNKDPEFKKAYEAARELNLDSLEDRLYMHATEKGVPGNISAIFGILNARRAAVFRQNMKVEHAGAVTMVTADLLADARRRSAELAAETQH